MRKAEFGFPGTRLRHRLVEAILRGEKTATAGLLVDLEREGEIRAGMSDPNWRLDDDTLVICERFRLVEQLSTS